MKKLILTVLALCLILVSCGRVNMVTVSSEAISAQTSVAETKIERVIKPHGLTELGYYVDAPAVIDGVEDWNGFCIGDGNNKIRIGKYAKKLKGDYTAVTVAPAASEEVALMYLQSFYNTELSAEGAVIEIGDKKYAPKELETYRVYQDDEISVYSIFSLVSEQTFKQQLDEYISSYRETPANETWLKIEDYFNTNIKALIKKMVLRYAAGYALETLRYTVEASAETVGIWDTNRYPKDKAPDGPAYLVANGDYGRRWGAPYTEKLSGQYNVIFAVLHFDKGHEQTVPIMYLQTYESKELVRTDTRIWIDGKSMQPEELRDYIVYTDNNITVYNFYKLIDSVDFHSRIDDCVKAAAVEGYDTEWALKLNVYVNNNIKKLIQKAEAESSTGEPSVRNKKLQYPVPEMPEKLKGNVSITADSADMAQIATKLFEKDRSRYIDDTLPAYYRLLDFHINSVETIAGDLNEFAVRLKYDFHYVWIKSDTYTYHVGVNGEPDGNNGFKDECRELRIKRTGDSSYSIINTGTGGIAVGLKSNNNNK
ncbi:hypothetical protein [Acetanaerobacterium elongatum]|uniref:Uncharacterized protein n=1 Tax=Acetanaerobacterium elongatum TaxID=258515 RepID=A0A1H0G2V5_9FIRM|nr:hypothetical protein [Acetanaerobacterium elongatum]SDO01248.1 hypothetical protein SAMN05192585_1471 [Acetanaerobacterium elongatum]